MEDISEEELQREITEILKNASLANTSTKKVIQKLEKKLGIDLSDKKKLIDQLVMDYVNELESESDEEEEEEEVVVKKKKKKQEDDEEEEERDDSNDSDWGVNCDHQLLDGDDHNIHNYPTLHQEPTISTSQLRRSLPQIQQPKKAIILKRVAQTPEDDESEIFGKLTAKKLRKLPERDRDSLMIEINQLIYNKCHNPVTKRKSPEPLLLNPKAKMPAQFKRIYRLDSLPKNVKTVPEIRPKATSTNKPTNDGYNCNIM